MLAFLPELAPDVLCLEEVVHTPNAPAAVMDYRDPKIGTILPQRARMFDEICEALPGHRATFCPAARGDLWHGEHAYPSEWGLATFVRRELTVIGQVQDFAHGGFGAHGYGDHPRSRSAHVVRLYDFVADQPVTIAHLHGLRDLAGKDDTPERAAQAHCFADLIDVVHREGERLVVCGDLNVCPDSETLRILQSRLGLTELVTSRGFETTRTALYLKPERFADYMFVNDAVTVAAFDVLTQPEVSDHATLVLELS
ncbi:endonuclease/exonuclease/phosphatase [Ahrensia sp. R2A130]|nr:endonuclease/exonuclease/phosphatase [Ahrensia sp. R2A130]